MKKFLLLLSFPFIVYSLTLAQVFTNSNLPIILINTDAQAEIPDDPKILATMKIIYKGVGQRNYISDQNNLDNLNYDGRIEIETRGSSSQTLPKKPYGFTTLKTDNITNNNTSLLDMPSEHDWILNSLGYEPSLIRDYVCYNLSRNMGQYATRTVYCELVINDDYKGLYLLQEKIKSDDNRVDVMEISMSDNTAPYVTGGYITKADKDTGGDPIAFQMSSTWGFNDINFIHHQPRPEDVTNEQNDYIHNEFIKLGNTTADHNISFNNGFPSVIDIPSFIDFMIINELSSNADAYSLSTYFHKDRNGKLRAGPIWDLNLTYGNDLFIWGFDRSKTDVWQFADGGNDGPKFWTDLFDNTQFKCYLSKRWNELTQPGNVLNIDTIETLIDETVTTISEAIVREEERWGAAGDHELEISNMKTFIAERINWMNDNIGTYEDCSNSETPPLVMTKIMYNPNTTMELPISNDQEFIELLNNGNTSVNLTGVYFGGTGLVYQFPFNSTIAAHTAIILASNAEIFETKYGFAPYGEYTRHLSDKSQEIVLADGFGNVIDKVQYSDKYPWPDADGNGYFLDLIDANSDNNVASNWTATNGILSINSNNNQIDITLFPNPVVNVLTIKSAHTINSIQLFDMQGRQLKTISSNSLSGSIDMSYFISGTYLLKVITQNKSFVKEIVKK